MFTGIAAGVFSALFMSISYVFSRAFIRKYKDPVRLSIFSQLVMTFGGLAALITSLFFVKIPFVTRLFEHAVIFIHNIHIFHIFTLCKLPFPIRNFDYFLFKTLMLYFVYCSYWAVYVCKGSVDHGAFDYI